MAPWPLGYFKMTAFRLFQNDYITSFKFKKLNIFFVPISNIILNGWRRI